MLRIEAEASCSHSKDSTRLHRFYPRYSAVVQDYLLPLLCNRLYMSFTNEDTTSQKNSSW